MKHIKRFFVNLFGVEPMTNRLDAYLQHVDEQRRMPAKQWKTFE